MRRLVGRLKRVRKRITWRRLTKFLRLAPYLLRVSRRPELRMVQRSYLDGIPLCVFSEPLRFARMFASSEKYPEPYQRPPSLYVPHLSAAPFPEPDGVSRLLEQEFETIAAEFDSFTNAEDPFQHSGAFVKEGTWRKFSLAFLDQRYEENIARCPQTWAVVDSLPIFHHFPGAVYFSMIKPGTHVSPHFGPTNIRLRYHLALEDDEDAQIRVAQEWRTWRRGECLILDDSFEHEVRHEGTRRRVVLLIDCWHPDVTEPEREFLAEVVRRGL